MYRLVIFILAAMFISCAGSRANRTLRTVESPEAKEAEPERKDGEESPLVTVTSGIDLDPVPVGGFAAIQAAVQEPEEVWKENKAGTTVVEARLNANGKILGTKVYKSSGYPGMDAEAMMAVARVRWKPARKNDQPVAAVVRVPVDFNMATDLRSNKD